MAAQQGQQTSSDVDIPQPRTCLKEMCEIVAFENNSWIFLILLPKVYFHICDVFIHIQIVCTSLAEP